MKELFGIPVIETEEDGDTIYLMPPVRPVVYVSPGGYSFEETLAAEQQAIIEAYTQAARRGEIGVIKNVKA